MPASIGSVLAALRPAPAAPAHRPPSNGLRTAAPDFFARARQGRAVTGLPPFRDGDSVSCPLGTEWMRYDGRWIIPGQPGGLALTDETVTTWWHTRYRPGSRFALVHRLTAAETDRITHDHYISSCLIGDMFAQDPVTGTWLRQLARQATRTRTVSVHLELPTGIVTLHSRREGDVFFHPATAPAPPRAAGPTSK
ncbi:hypothetical protein [Streptomyces sp. NPDC015350]|uniref:hypothetical protein n=1 Tax=Streptomyces sp. NPDC015350 TaxID=3364955 RepID=UPI0036F7ED3C